MNPVDQYETVLVASHACMILAGTIAVTWGAWPLICRLFKP